MKKISKLLSVILCLAIVMSFAVAVSAEENDGAISTMDELVTGNYYIVCSNGEGLGTVDGTWILAEENAIWSVTVTDNGVTLCDSNGTFIAPKGGDKNGLSTTEYEWAVSCNNGMFTFSGQGSDTVKLAFNSDSQYLKFRGYKNTTISGNPDTYPCEFALYPIAEAVTPAGPVACQIPGTLTYTFPTNDAASAGVLFQWTATSAGELSVMRMGENYMTQVNVNGTYGVIGNVGYTVNSGDLVEIIVYGYSAGTVTVPVEFEAAGSSGNDATGTENNPHIVSANTAYEKTLDSGEYFYQYTASVAGEVTINLTNLNGGDTHNMEVYVNGDTTRVYSNWDNDGSYITLNVAAGDVLTMKVYFDWPGSGSLSFTVVAEVADVEPEPPVEPAEPTLRSGKYVFSWNGLTFGALPEDYNYGWAPAGHLNNLAETDYITITNLGDGTFTMQDCYGRYIYMTGTYNSFNVGTEATDAYLWTLEDAGNGQYYIKNVEKEKYIAYSEQYTTWGCYSDISASSALTITSVGGQNPGTGDMIFAVISLLAISGMGITAVVSKKN